MLTPRCTGCFAQGTFEMLHHPYDYSDGCGVWEAKHRRPSGPAKGSMHTEDARQPVMGCSNMDAAARVGEGRRLHAFSAYKVSRLGT